MADRKAIQLQDGAGNVYDIKDAEAREELSSVKGAFDNKFDSITETTRNLFDDGSTVLGALLSDGSISDDTTCFVSDFIDVDSSDFVLSWSVNPTDNKLRVGFYDSSKVFQTRTLSDITSTQRSKAYTNTSYKYIRVSLKTNTEKFQVEIGNAATAYIPNRTAVDAGARNNINANFPIFQKAVDDVGDVDNIKYKVDPLKFCKYSISSGELVPDRYTICNTQIAPLNRGVDFISLFSSTYRFRIAYYANGSYISGSAGNTWYENTKLVLNPNYVTADGFRVFITFIPEVTHGDIVVSEALEDFAANNNEFSDQIFSTLVQAVKKNTEDIENISGGGGGGGITDENYDVVIVGGGAGGVGCAYALKNSGLKVALIDANEYLGGTHTNAYVASLAPSVAPPFLKDLFYDQMKKNQACISVGEHSPMSYSDAIALPWKKTYYHNPTSYCLNFNPKSMGMKYYEDLVPYIDIYLNTKFVSAEAENGVITKITTNRGDLYAKQFIDCTAQDDVLRYLGGTVFYGGDSSTRYQSAYGFTEDHGYSENYDFCNAATLLYRITQGEEDLSGVTADYYNNAPFWLYNTDPRFVYISTANYLDGDSGMKVINNGIQSVYNSMKTETIKHWKTIKNGMMIGQLPHDTSTYKFNNNAPMLGIRESYRAGCERILHESDIYVKATLENYQSAESDLDKFIGIGGYIADLLSDPHISQADRSEINASIKMYGVPYGCLVPKNFKNLLVASRGAGMSHIAASSFRLSKNMMQLGWAAGWATIIMQEDELEDYRDVDIEKLQTEEYSDFIGTLTEVLSM